MVRAKKRTSGHKGAASAASTVPVSAALTDPLSTVSTVPRTQEQLQDVRNQVINVILDGSVEMTERLMRLDHGNPAALRFLWKIAGLFPKLADEGADEQDMVSKALLERLGLFEELPLQQNGGEGDVKSEQESPDAD